MCELICQFIPIQDVKSYIISHKTLLKLVKKQLRFAFTNKSVAITIQGPHERGKPENVASITEGLTNIHTIIFDFHWKDQGWGNTKGYVLVMSSTNDTKISDENVQDYSRAFPYGAVTGTKFGEAPHELTQKRLLISNNKNRDEEETFNVWANAGGGGGHSLSIHNAVVFGVKVDY